MSHYPSMCEMPAHKSVILTHSCMSLLLVFYETGCNGMKVASRTSIFGRCVYILKIKKKETKI